MPARIRANHAFPTIYKVYVGTPIIDQRGAL